MGTHGLNDIIQAPNPRLLIDCQRHGKVNQVYRIAGYVQGTSKA